MLNRTIIIVVITIITITEAGSTQPQEVDRGPTCQEVIIPKRCGTKIKGGKGIEAEITMSAVAELSPPADHQHEPGVPGVSKTF
jgi:hypothetical protein